MLKDEPEHNKVLQATTLHSYLANVYQDHAEANIASHRRMLAGLGRNVCFVMSRPITAITEMDLGKWRLNRSNTPRVSRESRAGKN